jgi:hypothetical protein
MPKANIRLRNHLAGCFALFANPICFEKNAHNDRAAIVPNWNRSFKDPDLTKRDPDPN